ncbi:MAG: MarC family protein [Candidatus Omnitrophica bacterium]|nr:MarC family protein [Candidatus Omnitrophota bacterium]MCM8807481.1 MarC family protein [Candidatus Omnitrophota bacterium]
MKSIFFDNFLIFLVLLNPVSKIVILSSLGIIEDFNELKKISLKSTATAMLILFIFSFAGTFILKKVFKIEIYSLQIVGGVVLFLIGLRALQKGEFFEIEKREKVSDIAVVPIASPMIAGPATITASISQSAIFGSFITILSIFCALMINFVIMLFAGKINLILKRLNLLGPLIRITGLFIASIGINMTLTGIKTFLK